MSSFENFGKEYTEVEVYSWKDFWDLTKSPPVINEKYADIEFLADDLANYNGYVFRCDSENATLCKLTNPTTRGQSIWTFMPDLICTKNA
jgi:hypothetical protein